MRLKTALEMCICSTHCDAPVLAFLLDTHCRLVGAKQTFIGADFSTMEQSEDENNEDNTGDVDDDTNNDHNNAIEDADNNDDEEVSTQIGDHRFTTLLHWALKAKAMNWLMNVVVDTANKYRLARQLCLKQDTEGHTPLHLAIMLNAAPDVVQHMLDICPEAIRIRDDDQRTAMHLVRGG